MGIHGNDGANPAEFPVKIYGKKLRPQMGKHYCLGQYYFGSTAMHNGLLP